MSCTNDIIKAYYWQVIKNNPCSLAYVIAPEAISSLAQARCNGAGFWAIGILCVSVASILISGQGKHNYAFAEKAIGSIITEGVQPDILLKIGNF